MNPTQRGAAARERRARWRLIVEQAARSGLPVRLFCQEQRVDEARFYYWRRMLAREASGQEVGVEAAASAGASFVLVGPQTVTAEEYGGGGAEVADAALELVVERGWRLRIPCGVDEATLRRVVTALAAQA